MNNNILSAIDIGTNSFHLVVAQINDKGRFKILTREKEVVRLGKSSKDMKYISEEAKERGIAALKRFKLISDSFNAGRIRAVATSAVREAVNREEFINEASEKTGINVEVVSGFEEARLIYLGVLQALPVFKKKILLVDIGGGSTEFLIGLKGDVIFADSVKIGAVRLTEGFFSEGKFKTSLIDSARMYARSVLNPLIRRIKECSYEMIVGTSGTITNLGSMIYSVKQELDDEATLNNFTYTASDLNNIVKKIFRCGDSSQTARIPGLDTSRADIITAGSIILEQIFTELSIRQITLSSFALREGIILDTIDKDSGNRNLGVISDIRYKSVLSLAQHCNYDKIHCEKVLDLSVKIFDYIYDNFPEFNLNVHDKEFLEAASLLHDIGHSISHSQHHRHSYYLIKNSEMLGFNFEELEIIANIARYHRKSHPKQKHENFSRLSEANKSIIRKLSSILRISDGLDRGHKGSVDRIELERKGKNLNIKPISENGYDLTLEIWGANMRKELFEETYNYKINFNK
jgi:exopolyphosphatase/guanosine-5'-triphosphate,3'-diphosphate pyrophosphatase